MDFNEAAVFVRVVQAGSFSAAARQLGLPTSTVSTRVARLEQRLGVTLLQRTTRRLHLTEAGSLYFEHASTGLGYLMEAEAALDEARQQPQGTLKMTAPADLGDALFGHLLAETQQRYPALSLELWLTERYVDLVAEGVDVAIRMGELRDSSLIAKSLGTIQWALFASPTYLQQAKPMTSPVELAKHPCVQFTPMGRHHWDLQRGMNDIRVPLPGRLLVNNIGVVKTMAENGQGVALLPTFICQSSVQQGGLQRILPEWRGQADAVHLVYPKQRFMPPKLRGFIDLSVTALKPLFVA
ncbi:LysR family transcriptional regulator [Methylophilus sp. 3sh_L]|uniref:LysR family transcriptional regulator n=1 Tax=Methylophilus sp. 3sh_L TaxID=3377114 RepID=UPI00398F3776